MKWRASIAITGVVLSALTLAGCSYLFRSGVAGTYTSTGYPLLGYVTSRNEQAGGTLSLGSAEKQECEGRYEVSRKGTSILGLSIRDQVYRGRIYCLDGRVGTFELVSAKKGRTGVIAGEIGGQKFRAKLIEPIGKECGDDDCRWGVRWTYENEREQMKIYQSVERNERAQIRPLLPG
jgi:hypothetical protein